MSHTAGTPALSEIAKQIPLGFACRSCGGAAYNWLTKCGRYIETGEGCCPDFRDWIEKARASKSGSDQS